MAPRHNACHVMHRVPDAVRALKAHQPEHQQLAQGGSDEQSAALLQSEVDFVHMPLLRVNLRRETAAELDLPALHAAKRRPAVQGVRRELGGKCTVGQVTSRVRFKPGDKGVARMLPTPAIVLTNCRVTARTWGRRERELWGNCAAQIQRRRVGSRPKRRILRGFAAVEEVASWRTPPPAPAPAPAPPPPPPPVTRDVLGPLLVYTVRGVEWSE
jgi:hypothetical protein